MASTTAVRVIAQPKYPQRFRAAYGHRRSRAGAPCRSSNTKTPPTHPPAPRRCIHIHPELPPRSELLRPSRAPHALHGHSAEIESRESTSRRRQDGRSINLPPVARANMCAVADWSAEVVRATSPFHQTASRHRDARPRFRRISRRHPSAFAHYGTGAKCLRKNSRGESITTWPNSADWNSKPTLHNLHRRCKQCTPNRESDRHPLPVAALRDPHSPSWFPVSTTTPTQQRPLRCPLQGILHSSQRALMKAQLILLRLIHLSYRMIVCPLGHPRKSFLLNEIGKPKSLVLQSDVLSGTHFPRTSLINPHPDCK